MRLRKVKNAPVIIAENADVILENPIQYRGKWNQFFKNDNPIEIEIGMGKGKFISTKARNHPNINYIGIEKFDSVIIRAIDAVKENDLENLRLLHYDAKELRNVFASEEIDKIYLNFSDPWPKSRHAKRRLTHFDFLEVYQDILKSSGCIEFKTDNEKLFDYSLEVFDKKGLTIHTVDRDLHKEESTDIITTEYEERFKQMGNKILYCKVSFRRNQ